MEIAFRDLHFYQDLFLNLLCELVIIVMYYDLFISPFKFGFMIDTNMKKMCRKVNRKVLFLYLTTSTFFLQIFKRLKIKITSFFLYT